MHPQAPRQHTANSSSAEAAREHLSALADGEASAHGVGLACDAWRTDAEARRTWHTYQLIGDVLRSDELASRPARDAAFLAAVRERLAKEPAVLAPAPLPTVPTEAKTPHRAQPRWVAPTAIAAGFVAVAGVLVVTRMNPPEANGPRAVMASSSAPAAALALGNGAAVLRSTPAGAAMLRDAQLDDYIDAHQSARRGGAVVLPGSALRSVELVVPASRQP